MTIEKLLSAKLEPHAKRIKDGNGNDFDYLPAVLLQLLEEQDRQSQLFTSTLKSQQAEAQSSLLAIESKIESIAEQNRQSHLLATALKNQQTETQSGLLTTGKKVESLQNNYQLAQHKLTRWLAVSLAANVVAIALAVVILQRH